MSNITPTRGRIVWFHPGSWDNLSAVALTYGNASMAAIVCHVWNDHMVNLDVIDPTGEHHKRMSVDLLQPDQIPPGPASQYCEWMPYQVGQATMAARADAIAEASKLGKAGA